MNEENLGDVRVFKSRNELPLVPVGSPFTSSGWCFWPLKGMETVVLTKINLSLAT